MMNLTKCLAICLLLSASTATQFSTAQDGKKMRHSLPVLDDVYADNCRICDSLGNAYLAVGDTSMALYFYQQYLDVNPNPTDKKIATDKLRSNYNHEKRAFYHGGY